MEKIVGDAWVHFGAGATSPAEPLPEVASSGASKSWLPRGLRPLFLEDEAQPLSLNWGMWLRRATYIFIWAATLLILFAELATRLGSTDDAFWTVLSSVFLTSVHLFYLYLIFFLLILSSLPHRQYRQRIWFPSLFFLYCVVNFLRAFLEYRALRVDSWIPATRLWQPRLQYASLGLLTFYYFAWFLRDYFKRENLGAQERRTNTYWLVVEIVSLAILAKRVLDLAVPSLFIFPSYTFTAHSETAVIALSLGLWSFLQWYEGSFAERTFRSSYQEYLGQNTFAFSPENFQGKTCSLGSVRRILDFGCGDGTRLRQNLDWLGVTELSSLTIHGFDINRDWKRFFLETFAGTSAKFLSSIRDLYAHNHYDLVVISHCLYDVRSLHDVTKFLKQCDRGTKVLIRGTSPRSFFYLASRVQALRVLGRTQASYSWHLWALQSLVKDVGLTPLQRPPGQAAVPDAIVRQKYRLTDTSMEFAAKLLGDLYGGNTRENVSDVLEELLHRGDVHELPNDDVVFVFEKPN